MPVHLSAAHGCRQSVPQDRIRSLRLHRCWRLPGRHLKFDQPFGLADQQPFNRSTGRLPAFDVKLPVKAELIPNAVPAAKANLYSPIAEVGLGERASGFQEAACGICGLANLEEVIIQSPDIGFRQEFRKARYHAVGGVPVRGSLGDSVRSWRKRIQIPGHARRGIQEISMGNARTRNLHAIRPMVAPTG